VRAAAAGVLAIVALAAVALAWHGRPGTRAGVATPAPAGAAPSGAPSGAASGAASGFPQLYGRVVVGMTLDEVAALLGGPGEEIAWRRLHGETHETRVWTDGGGGTIYVTFLDGKAILKSQLGVPVRASGR
jgi:hypothetical protein